MSDKLIKQRCEGAVFNDIKVVFEEHADFEGVGWYYRQQDTVYEPPSLLVACENAPLHNPDLLIYYTKIDVYTSTPLTKVKKSGAPVDPEQLHRLRAGLVENHLTNDVEGLIARLGAQTAYPLLVHELDVGESESFQTERTWVDKQPLHVYCQLINEL